MKSSSNIKKPNADKVCKTDAAGYAEGGRSSSRTLRQMTTTEGGKDKVPHMAAGIQRHRIRPTGY
ncbi:uncharacterized protein Dana_GF27700 [Drosophila ananassae]|uniref:Uncharacterized protein n=1 Tax=Drosophila ananassae TaxID=7217 RepID=A0A0P8Y4S4_DROAN|nr:uncharacterized protein Dana_GF27700 [Drosophila ananassae]